MAGAVNPYVAGGPVGGSVAFVGRSDETSELARVLDGDQKRIAVLSGPPGMGRTSLLTELAHVFEDRGGLHPVHIDLHNRAWDPLDDVISSLADAVGRALRITEPELGHWAENRFAERWLPLVLERIHEDDRIILIFEEFPVVFDPRSRQAAGAFLPWFAGLCEQFPDRLRAVFTTDLRQPDQEAVIRRYFPDLHRVELSVLDLAAAWGLVRMSHLDRSLRWSNAAVERVLALSGAHPYLTQLLCASVWDRSRHDSPSGNRPEVTAADVETAIIDVVDAGTALYESLWSGLPPACRVVAAAVAWQDERNPEAHRIAELLHTCGVRVVTRVLEHDAPRELRRQGLFHPDARTLGFTVPLVRLWIRARRPLPDVLRDLDHIDPMAERLFQEAERIWQTAAHEGARRDAIAQLDEVLELNPNHAAATELLSVVHERRGDIDTALRYLERLFEAQPARARPKLVRLLLQKAHEESVPERRVRWFDRVLQVAPGHGEATRERARILERPPAQHAVRRAPARPAKPAQPVLRESVVDDPSRISDVDAIRREPPPGETQPKWSPQATVQADDDRLERLYKSGVVALEKGDRDSALIHLGRVAAARPTYRETTRHLYRAVHDVDPASQGRDGVSKATFGSTVAVSMLLAAGLLVSIVTRPGVPEADVMALTAAAPAVTTPHEVDPVEAPGSAAPPEPVPSVAAEPDAVAKPDATPPQADVGAHSKGRPATSAASLVKQGWSKVEAGALSEAEALFDVAVTRNPRSADAHYSLAYAAEKLGSADTAFIHYCSALHYAGRGTEVQRDVQGRLRAIGKSCD